MDFYKLISKNYGELYGEEQKVKYDIIKAHLNIKNDDLLLDVGCGTGYNFGCKVVGIDPSMELLQQNRKNNNRDNHNTINKVLAKAENIPFRDGTFDKVVSVTSMHNFDDFEKGVSEIKRVGKKDFAFSILKKARNFESIETEIKGNFNVTKIIDGKKDWIFICSVFFGDICHVGLHSRRLKKSG